MMELTLQQLRVLKGITQKEMAVNLGVHEQTYMKWEKDPEGISVRNAKFISALLGVNYNAIFFKEDSNLMRVKGGENHENLKEVIDYSRSQT